MDKKDLEEGTAKNGKGDDIIYENKPQEPMFVKEARTVAYSVDEEIEYAKYLKLPKTERAEFIDGKIYFFAAPTEKHQELLGTLHVRFHNYLHGKPCKVFIAPFGVKINYDFDPHSRDTLQPDLLVICNKDKLDGKVLNGTPDLVIEVLSPSTLQHDKVFKYKRYLSVGVKEYWLVDPDNDEITVNILRSGKYVKRVYSKGDIIKVGILDDLHINVTNLIEGYKGDEIVEVEVARKEEREKAEAEKNELLQRAEADKLEIAKSLLIANMPIGEISLHTGLAEDDILKLNTRSGCNG